jgi:hypothetical protein
MSKSSNRRQQGHLTVWVKDDLREAIEAAAEAERRPVSNLIKCVVEDWLKNRSSGVRVADRGV